MVDPNMTNEVRHIRHNFLFSAFLFIALFIPQTLLAIAITERQFGAYPDSESGSYGYSSEVPGTEGMDEMTVVSTLRHDIQLLDEEIMKCERKRKGWVAATVVGGVGVVGTGIGAIVQHNKIQDKKSELQQVQSNVADTKQSVHSAQERLNNM